jgi:small subunit ribosomal protein S17e
MGRIKTQLVKRTTLGLYNEHRERFKKDFEENKTIVAELLDFPSKKIRNTVAGYLTRLVKTEKEI